MLGCIRFYGDHFHLFSVHLYPHFWYLFLKNYSSMALDLPSLLFVNFKFFDLHTFVVTCWPQGSTLPPQVSCGTATFDHNFLSWGNMKIQSRQFIHMSYNMYSEITFSDYLLIKPLKWKGSFSTHRHYHVFSVCLYLWNNLLSKSLLLLNI